MTHPPTLDPGPDPMPGRTLSNDSGLRIELLANGAIRRMDCHDVLLNLFPGNEVEGGPANLWLRLHNAHGVDAVPLLGPLSPLSALALQPHAASHHAACGDWRGLRLCLQLRLAASESAWFWHLQVENRSAEAQTLDLLLLQDIGLSPYGATRLNEYYVSHYIDLAALAHARHGWVLGARQNLSVEGRNPWAMVGSLRHGTGYATDGLQVQGLALRTGAPAPGIAQNLPSRRLQHEHALLAIQDEALTLIAGARADLGFFGRVQADHPQATRAADLAWVDATLALPEASAPALIPAGELGPAPARTLFASAPWLAADDLDEADLDALFGPQRRHPERDGTTLLSFFCAEQAHVVLRAKELRVQRPHGHLLHTGTALVPDESALTSTTWMAGGFHSMVTQGHVSINRFLSTVRSWLGLFRSHGQRLFVQIDGAWQQLGVPSAFEMEPGACRWIYQCGTALIEVRSRGFDAPHALGLQLRVLAGAPLRLLVTHHIALGGDDGSAAAPLPLQIGAEGVFIGIPPDSALAERFPEGGFQIAPEPGTVFERVGGDELVFEDGRSHGQPFVCIRSGLVEAFGLRITGWLVGAGPSGAAGPAPANAAAPVSADDAAPAPAHETASLHQALLPVWTAAPDTALAPDAARLAEVLPWYRHNALVHYLAPRGLEQYSGGGWGTRDVCQGPLEMLLALDRVEPVRDLLVRVFAAQNTDGDWPQWFMFFEREREIRAGDSHGDIVYWPLLGLARYLLASEDAAVLEQSIPFFTPPDAAPESGTLWQHVERALALVGQRRIGGTRLAAYGHGDWNDSLQPADPELRERLCSAWTVTLHHEMLGTLARALRRCDREAAAAQLEREAALVRSDFQRLLVVDGVVTGYALFAPDQPPQLLLHPQDQRTGVRYSLLPMMHAILDNMLTPAQARTHLDLISSHLTGPDGARLFDRPLEYRGGPQQLFQRAESSAFFGREIGLMYMHAHLRYAQMLAHLGQAQRFFHALCKAHPLGLREHVPTSNLRQANCYFSSSDAAFADRYQAQRDYAQIAQGTVPLDGGWRIYSSGPGIAIALVVGSLLGIRREKSFLVIDPVMPPALDGLRTRVALAGQLLDIEYRLGPDGCGPTRLELNGVALPFEPRANPYRASAAQLPMARLLALLAHDGNALVVHTG